MNVTFYVLNAWYKHIFEHGTPTQKKMALDWFEMLVGEWLDHHHPHPSLVDDRAIRRKPRK